MRVGGVPQRYRCGYGWQTPTTILLHMCPRCDSGMLGTNTNNHPPRPARCAVAASRGVYAIHCRQLCMPGPYAVIKLMACARPDLRSGNCRSYYKTHMFHNHMHQPPFEKHNACASKYSKHGAVSAAPEPVGAPRSTFSSVWYSVWKAWVWMGLKCVNLRWGQGRERKVFG